MDAAPSSDQKKGLGVLAWIGVGCGGVVALVLVAGIVLSMLFGGKLKDFMREAEKNPARASVNVAMKISGGQLVLVAEDDARKRYTLKDKKSGELTTFYWDEKKGSLEGVTGDFSAIPGETKEAAPVESAAPAPATPASTEPAAPAAGAAPSQN
jgi:hypothetical protein